MEKWHLFIIASILFGAITFIAPSLVVAQDGGVMTGVRGGKLERYTDNGLTALQDSVPRSEVKSLLTGHGAVTEVDGDAFHVEFRDGAFWVKRTQARLKRAKAYSTDCNQQLAGASTGSSRGMGGGCK